MSLSENTQAVLLLTAHLSKESPAVAKPLTNGEWARLAYWLHDKSYTPSSLLQGSPTDKLKTWSDSTVSIERIERLLERGTSLAVAVEKWTRAGLWLLSRSDKAYPNILKKRLAADAPPVLYGCGNPELLSRGGLAVVGSRKVGKKELDFSSECGEQAANEGRSIVSGGARGVDETAMLGALEVEGTAVGVLADSLLRVSTSSKWRKHLQSNSLVLATSNNPEAGFSVGHAMQRNKYIYCLADAALVVHSGTGGGTWNGAMENLKKEWVPLWVAESSDRESGNEQLIGAGARRFSEEASITMIFATSGAKKKETTDLLNASGNTIAEDRPTGTPTVPSTGSTCDEDPSTLSSNAEILSLYDVFVLNVRKLCEDKERNAKEIASELEIQKGQADLWIKRAVSEGKLKKLNNPVRYTASQGSLF